MNYESKYLKYKEKYLSLKKDIYSQGLSNNSRFKEKYINLKKQQGGVHSCPFRLNQIVRIIGPAGSPYLNILGKIDGMKFDTSDPQLESVNQICTDIQLIIDSRKRIHIKPTEIELLENNEYTKGVFMLQAIPESLGIEILKKKDMRELVNMYDLRNPIINSIINKTPFDFTNPSEILFDRIIEIFPNVRSFNYSAHIELGRLHELRNLRKLIVNNFLYEPLDRSLGGLVNLESLVFNEGGYFNQTLGTSLNSFINLKELKFCSEFDNGGQPLGESLSNLRSLKILDLGNCVHPLGESLFNLRSLQTLYVGQNFNQELGNSLQNLRNLKRLVFSYEFNNGGRGLKNSFDNLLNLEELIFVAKVDYHYVGISPDGIIDNQIIHAFNQDLDFLLNLRKLKLLYFGSESRNILKDSFRNLHNLEELVLSGPIEFGNSLRYLTKLKRFHFQFNLLPENDEILALLPATCKITNGNTVKHLD
jgi:hypothetical protein